MKTLLTASIALCAASMPAQDKEFDTYIETTLTALRSDPDAFRNVTISFTVQFASLGQLQNPFFTRFTPTEFTNFYCWADEQPIWQRESYDNLFGNLFYAKAGDQLEEVFGLQMYQRLKVTGIVRNTFQGMPWIEVTEFEELPGQVDAAVLAHMYRGEQFMGERRWQRAIAEFTLAPGSGVPQEVQRSAYRNLGICYLRIGESDQALSALRTAKALTTKRDSELDMLLGTAEDRPSDALDRVVGQTALKDFERPMWEAFEESSTTDTRTMR